MQRLPSAKQRINDSQALGNSVSNQQLRENILSPSGGVKPYGEQMNNPMKCKLHADLVS